MEGSIEQLSRIIKTKKNADKAVILNAEAMRMHYGEKNGENIERECMIGLISREIVLPLNKIENAKIIDRTLEEEGASLELAENFRKYAEKIGDNKKIIPFNSAKDFIQNSAITLSGFVKEICKADTAEKKEKRMNIFKPFIVKEFNFLRGYLDLLENYSDFERKELSDKDGYLGKKGKIKIEKDTKNPVERKERYLIVSAEMLEKSGSKRKGTVH